MILLMFHKIYHNILEYNLLIIFYFKESYNILLVLYLPNISLYLAVPGVDVNRFVEDN